MKKRDSDTGATIVEFTIVALLFFGLLGGFMYFAIYLYRYSVLADAMSATLRTVAVAPGPSSSNLIATLPDAVKQKIISMQAATTANGVTLDRVDLCRENSTCNIRIRMQWETPCYGFCIFVDALPTPKVYSTISIEEPCFLESAAGCGPGSTIPDCDSNPFT